MLFYILYFYKSRSQSFYLSLSLSVFLHLSLCLSVSLYLSVVLFLFLFFYLSLFLSVSLTHTLFLSLSLSLSLSLVLYFYYIPIIIYILYYLVFKILSSFVRDSSYHDMYYKGCGLLCAHEKSFNTAIPVRSLGPYMYVYYCTCIVHILVWAYLFCLTSFFDYLSFMWIVFKTCI